MWEEGGREALILCIEILRRRTEEIFFIGDLDNYIIEIAFDLALNIRIICRKIKPLISAHLKRYPRRYQPSQERYTDTYSRSNISRNLICKFTLYINAIEQLGSFSKDT